MHLLWPIGYLVKEDSCKSEYWDSVDSHLDSVPILKLKSKSIKINKRKKKIKIHFDESLKNSYETLLFFAYKKSNLQEQRSPAPLAGKMQKNPGKNTFSP